MNWALPVWLGPFFLFMFVSLGCGGPSEREQLYNTLEKTCMNSCPRGILSIKIEYYQMDCQCRQ